jgi:hypothetical protein
MSSSNQNQSGLIASGAMDQLNSGALLRPTAGSQSASERTVATVNVIARGVTDSLKSGGHLKGTVRSHSIVGGVEVAWVAVEIPQLGPRQILVRDEKHLQVGQEVEIECVPNLSYPKRHVFRMANGALAPSAPSRQ